ncbi:hypothetical protein LCGC14_2320230 [marine sediment metagenome]|uniref:Uncharacterized protein n=1 Tax=marine sediment metagenome TaxID=412755 RepID=A0A0F9CI25_9ZZZZ
MGNYCLYCDVDYNGIHAKGCPFYTNESMAVSMCGQGRDNERWLAEALARHKRRVEIEEERQEQQRLMALDRT